MSTTKSDSDRLLALLKPTVPTKLHAWRLLLVAAGALCGGGEPEAADLLGHFTGQPLKLKRAEDGLSAIAWTSSIASLTRSGLEQGRLLNLVPAPHFGRAYALALADAILGFADGLDFAGVDPDSFSDPGQAAFDALGRRAAALEILAEELPNQIDDAEVQGELLDLAKQTDVNILTLYRERSSGRCKPE